jgi:DNA repair protein RecO (recombination protein O)
VEERGTGFVLRTYPLTETSLIVHWLTREQGRLATVAKGARRPQSPFRGKLDLFFHADFAFARSRRSELHTLRELSLLQTYPALRRDLDRLRQAAYLSALIEASTETDTPLAAAYALFRSFLDLLAQKPAQPIFVHTFEIKWLNELGLLPEPASLPLTPGARQLMGKMHAFAWNNITCLLPSPGQLAEINRYLEHLLRQQLERVPRGRSEALTRVDSCPREIP